MADDFNPTMHRDQPEGNADDASADRLASYPEGGELGSPQGAGDRSGQGEWPASTPSAREPAGVDRELLADLPGARLGGPHATDTDADPGLPGHDQPAEGGVAQAGDAGMGGSLTDMPG